MNYCEFQNGVVEKIRHLVGEECEITIREVRKNNGVILNGLVITGKDTDVSPTIYLEPFYEAYLQGSTMQELVDEIYRIYDENHIEGQMNLDFFEDYGRVRNKIFHKVINYEQNSDFLEKVPHIRFLDLAIVCYCVYMNDLMGKGSIQIDRDFLDKWGITEEQLFKDAADNTANKLGPEVKSIQDMLFEMLLKEKEITSAEDAFRLWDETMDDAGTVPMYVMTVKGCSFGAVCIYHEEWMEAFYNKINMGFYILPSSIHELILIPKEAAASAQELQKMVKDVNLSCVLPQERLSDNVYYYNPLTKRVEIA